MSEEIWLPSADGSQDKHELSDTSVRNNAYTVGLIKSDKDPARVIVTELAH